VILAGLPALSLVVAIILHLSGDVGAAVTGWLVLAAVIGLYVALVWPIRYELTETELVVRFGLASSRVPYRAIRSVGRSRNILAAPALSMRRLAIDIGKIAPLLVSPAEPEAFLDDLESRTGHLVRDGDRLRPR
jgi:hypothetical protein